MEYLHNDASLEDQIANVNVLVSKIHSELLYIRHIVPDFFVKNHSTLDSDASIKDYNRIMVAMREQQLISELDKYKVTMRRLNNAIITRNEYQNEATITVPDGINDNACVLVKGVYIIGGIGQLISLQSIKECKISNGDFMAIETPTGQQIRLKMLECDDGQGYRDCAVHPFKESFTVYHNATKLKAGDVLCQVRK